jgi:hypothetical protein
MKKHYSDINAPYLFADLKMVYGKQENVANDFQQILDEKDPEKRKNLINKYVDLFDKQKENNGFIGKKDLVKSQGNSGFLMDDLSIYEMFFSNMIYVKNAHKEAPIGAITKKAIDLTIDQYFGLDSPDKQYRNSLSRAKYFDRDEVKNEEDMIQYPSIAVLKGKGLALCSEKATVSHNLWLLTGVTSYLIESVDSQFTNIPEEYKNDSHLFNIVQYNGKTLLVDYSLNNFAKINNDSIEKMFNGEPLIVLADNNHNVKNPGIYANAKKMINQKSMR